jgi:DHA2 family multidrug resistance protein-like MFS transporter
VFLLNVPVMALLLVLGPRLLPEYRDPEPGRFDLTSAALSLVAILAVIYGIKGMAEHGLTTSNVAAVVFGVAVVVVFLRRQGRLADPLLDLELFRRPAFRIALLSNTLGIFVIGGTLLFIAQYLQLVLGMGPLEAGLWALPGAFGFVVGSLVAPHIVRRVDPGLVVAVGLAVAAVGLALMTQVSSTSGLAVLIAGDVVMSFGVALVVTLTTDLIVASVEPERAGTASGLSETGAELGGALGVAVLGSIGVAIYRSGVSDALPDGLSADAHAAASDTLAGALSADGLPTSVLSAATESFTDGLQVAAMTGAVLAAVLAVAAALVLRNRSPRPEPCPEAAMATVDC